MEVSQVMGGTLYKSSSGVSFPERPPGHQWLDLGIPTVSQCTK